MVIVSLSASPSPLPLPGRNLFSSLPSTPPPNHPSTSTSTSTSTSAPQPPIPIPKYPPPRKSQKQKSQNPALKLHNRSNYYKPITRDGPITDGGDRSVVIGESGVSYLLPGAPFEFQFSYSETPNVKPIAIREPAFLPFAPPTMPRPWTGKAPLKSKKRKEKKVKLLESMKPPLPPGTNGVKQKEIARPLNLGKYSTDGKTREEILGEPLRKWEIRMLVNPMTSDNRQVNLGRDGLTHNMLELIHSHWKRSPVCKVRCKGVPTVDMSNVCHHIEDKTGGKIILRVGGVVYLFRGRNYNYCTRPQYPVMLWKPAAPVYPKLIQDAPGGLTKAEADELRMKGKSLLPICKLVKNGVYISLVKDVRDAFELSHLAKIDCRGLDPSDYKKIGAKLKDLVPCVLLSFDDEQILMWRGNDWKSMYPQLPPRISPWKADNTGETDDKNQSTMVNTSPKMLSLWKRAIESNKALVLDEFDLGPDALLERVEEFEGVSQATEHSYPALISSNENGHKDHKDSVSSFEDDTGDNYSSDDDALPNDEDDEEDEDNDDDDYFDDYVNYHDDEYHENDLYDVVDSSATPGSLPIDSLVNKMKPKLEQ